MGNAFKKLGHEVNALPLLGNGENYLKSGLNVLGKTKSFSTGGMGYTSLKGRMLELIQGQMIYLIKRIYLLLMIASKYDLLVVVGDVIPVTVSWLTGLPVVTYLVAYSSHYEGRLKLPWPCANCLSSDRFLKIYTRDILTANDLKNRFLGKVEFVGNPFMDPFLTKQEIFSQQKRRLGILPGSRIPEVGNNLCLILRVIDYLSNLKCEYTDISLDVALVSCLDDNTLKNIVTPSGWRLHYPVENHNPLKLIKNQSIVNIYRNSFVKVVKSSNVLICMAGTATEQAALLGKLIVQIEGKGPQFNPSFAEAQRRLLGPRIYCANGSVEEDIHMRKTCKIILDLLEKSYGDSLFEIKTNKEKLTNNKSEVISEIMAKSITNAYLKY